MCPAEVQEFRWREWGSKGGGYGPRLPGRCPSLETIEKLNANRVVTSAATLVVSVSVCRQISMQYIHEYFVA